MHPYITFDVFWRGMAAWLALISVLFDATENQENT
jgi:hypothetical protein